MTPVLKVQVCVAAILCEQIMQTIYYKGTNIVLMDTEKVGRLIYKTSSTELV